MNWYHVEDGICTVHPDTPDTARQVDADLGRGWYGSPEGPILHAGIQATAFKRTQEAVYATAAVIGNGWSTIGLDPDGEVTLTEITAEVITPRRPLTTSDGEIIRHG